MSVTSDLSIEQKINETLKGNFRIDAPLNGYTSLKIGGKTAFMIQPQDEADLKRVLKFLNSNHLPVRVIGNGTNLLVSDEKLPFAVLKLDAPFFREIFHMQNMVFARAGAKLTSLLKFSIEKELSGLEFLTGIPGTLGGAVYMNAGIKNKDVKDDGKIYLSIGDLIDKLSLMDRQGNIFTLDKSQAGFGYRISKLKDKIILGAYLKVTQKPADYIKSRIKEFLEIRLLKQKIFLPSAGCVFKNPEAGKISAGALIENSGLKGFSIGDAQVSCVHANFIVNKGRASFKQVRRLITSIQNKVYQDSGIKLELEVEIWERQDG